LTDICIGIQEATDTAGVRRVAQKLTSELEFDETSSGNVSLVVTEAARNLLKHAGGGEMILRSLESRDRTGIEILALDKGPGIKDLQRSFEDGYSTTGTSGTGLGAIARLSHMHEVYTLPGQGTLLMSRIWNRKPNGASGDPRRFMASGVSVPIQGETECGDAWLFQESERSARLTMADGLGHGPAAAAAAHLAIETAGRYSSQPIVPLMERIHAALKPTRGAAVSIAEIDSEAKVVRYIGVGNIAGAIVTDSVPMRRLVSIPGTAGHHVHKFMEYSYPWESRSHLLMHSDGLQTHWSFDGYPGLMERHPTLIAGAFYRDYSRGRDDVTVAVARETRPK
jgi:anti-sigma regulatory factor (Ser/Thr protein kinase)